jgi:hypothetical protein
MRKMSTDSLQQCVHINGISSAPSCSKLFAKIHQKYEDHNKINLRVKKNPQRLSTHERMMALGIISVEYCSWRKLGAEKIRSCLTRKDANPALQTPLSPVAGRSHDDHQDQHDNWAGEVC